MINARVVFPGAIAVEGVVQGCGTMHHPANATCLVGCRTGVCDRRGEGACGGRAWGHHAAVRREPLAAAMAG